MRWFRQAAKQGNAGAQFLLGFMYLAVLYVMNEDVPQSVQGVPRDDSEADRWLRRMAEQVNANPQYYQGVTEVAVARWFPPVGRAGSRRSPVLPRVNVRARRRSGPESRPSPYVVQPCRIRVPRIGAGQTRRGSSQPRKGGILAALNRSCGGATHGKAVADLLMRNRAPHCCIPRSFVTEFLGLFLIERTSISHIAPHCR